MKAKRIDQNGTLEKTTENVLEWFPELKQLFKNFNVDRIELKFKDSNHIFIIHDEMERYITGTDQAIDVHRKDMCSGNCCIHNPSDHHMKDFPTHWRDDRGLMERICKHGVGHPDPDDLAYKKKMGMDIKVESVHGCCCFCGTSKRIKGFTKYYITPDGKIWNNKLNRFMKPHKKDGYWWIQLNENGKRKYKGIHRLVAEAYIPNIENKRTVNHKNFNTDINEVWNLEWSTDSENIQHSYNNKRRENQKKICANNGRSKCKLFEDDVKTIK